MSDNANNGLVEASLGGSISQSTTDITTTTNQNAMGGTSAATATGASSNSLTTSTGSISLTQESPEAIAALSAGTATALQTGNAATMAGFALAGQLATNALDDARAALTPADARAYTNIQWIVGLLIVGLVAFLYFKRKG